MISIEQGSDKMKFNEVKLVNYENKILFGGRASKIIDGMYHIN